MDMKELRKNAEKVIAERFPNFNFSTLDWGELDPFYLEHPEEIPIEHEFIGYRQDGDVAEDYQGNLYLVLCDPGIHPIGSVCMEQSELDDAVKLGKREDYTGELLEEDVPCYVRAYITCSEPVKEFTGLDTTNWVKN